MRQVGSTPLHQTGTAAIGHVNHEMVRQVCLAIVDDHTVFAEVMFVFQPRHEFCPRHTVFRNEYAFI